LQVLFLEGEIDQNQSKSVDSSADPSKISSFEGKIDQNPLISLADPSK